MSYFPIKIRLADGTEKVIEYGHQVPKGVAFTVLETNLPIEEEKVVLNSGHAFEVMDRTSVEMHSFEDFINSHPLVEQFPELKQYANVVLEYLMKIYQVSANLSFDWDANPEATFEEMLASDSTKQMLKQEDEVTAYALMLSVDEATLLSKILESEIAERSRRPEVVELYYRIDRYKFLMERE